MRERRVALGDARRPVAIEPRNLLGLELPGRGIVRPRRDVLLIGPHHGMRTAVRRVILARAIDPAREESIEVFGVLEIFAHQIRRVGERDHVVFEPALVDQQPIDERAQKDDVGPTPNRSVDIGDRRSAREARVDVDDRCSAFLGLHDEAERDRVALREVRTFDEHAIAIRDILDERGRAAATE
jgi:hypothetical protein